MNTTRLVVLLQFLTIAAITTAAQSLDNPTSREGAQTVFSAESPTVDHPVLIPQAVLIALAKDPMVRKHLEYEHISDVDLPPSWFSAARVQLGDERNDLVIVALPPLMGANITSFWVFHEADHGYRLLLFAAAHDLTILHGIHMKLHDIEMTGETSQAFRATTYRFSGIRYVLHKQRTRLLP